ncbi:hypothetical protein NMG60_11004853 [Bertholletia excelsa]
MGGKQGRLLLTNGTSFSGFSGSARVNSFSSPTMAVDLHHGDEKMDGEDDPYWSTDGVEEIRWDAMFQDLKPT